PQEAPARSSSRSQARRSRAPGCVSFPFQLLESLGHVVTMIVVEKSPSRSLADRNGFGCGFYSNPVGNRLARLAQQRREVAFESARGGREIDACRAMPRYDSVSTACAERAQLLEP